MKITEELVADILAGLPVELIGAVENEQADTEIEITEAMVKAGLVVLEAAYDEISPHTQRARDAVLGIYRQMQALQP